MTTNHTPGPWAVGEAARYSVWAGNKQVASCRWLLDDGNFAPECAGDYEGRANAALIAAAPDLLAALREMLAELDGRIAPHGYIYRDTGGMILARAAIAKAEGRP